MEINNNKAELKNKLIKNYDKNKNGKIEGNEVSIFKADCKKLYKQAYGKETRQLRLISSTLNRTEIEFVEMDDAGQVRPEEVDFNTKKYKLALRLAKEGETLEDSKLNLADYAGVVLHESEHLKQMQKDFYTYKREFNNNPRRAQKEIENSKSSDRYELYAEMERMYFFKKIGVYKDNEGSETYKNFVEQMDKIGIDPAKNRKEFIEKFDEEAFLKTINTPELYPNFNDLYYEDKDDKNNLKNLLF